MSGELNLDKLLYTMSPVLQLEPYVFVTSSQGFTNEEMAAATMVFQETEGVTLIIKQATAKASGRKSQSTWAMITLQVHSDLNAVGFLAAITQKLAQAGISVNAVSAFYHDHIFVPWNRREEALSVLRSFQV